MSMRMKKAILSIITVIGLLQCSDAQTTQAVKFHVFVLVNANGNDSTSAVTITANSKPYKTLASTGRALPLDLDLNTYYLVKCTRAGYQDKTIVIDTKVPKGRELQKFAQFNCYVTLLKNNNTKPTNKPIGGVKYNPTINEFDQDQSIK